MIMDITIYEDKSLTNEISCFWQEYDDSIDFFVTSDMLQEIQEYLKNLISLRGIGEQLPF